MVACIMLASFSTSSAQKMQLDQDFSLLATPAKVKFTSQKCVIDQDLQFLLPALPARQC